MNVLSYSPDGQFIATGGDDGKVGGHVRLFNRVLSLSFRSSCGIRQADSV